MSSRTLKEILAERDQFDIDDENWKRLNVEKTQLLERLKPSTQEEIIYFNEVSLIDIPKGFSVIEKVPQLPYKIEKRSLLEYNPETRHPIPYAIVKYKKYYFFTLRQSGSGEIRLIGQEGLLGGHVGKEDVDSLSLSKTLLRALKREIEEEAGITMDMITAVNLKGIIKNEEGVDGDHLGFVYELRLNTRNIKLEEKGKLKGVWIHENDLTSHYESMESWAKIVYDNIILKNSKKLK